MNSRPCEKGIVVRASSHEMTTATGRLMTTVIPQTLNEFHSAVRMPGWVSAERQLPRPHSGVPTNTSNALLKV